MMNYLKKFESFQTHDEIHKICKKYDINNYTINSDGSIDVDGDVNLHFKMLKRLPLKFNNVSGDFDCSDNNLTTLEGAPQSVHSFDCSYNNLTTLECVPKSVDVHFLCNHNNLTTLKGAPQFVTGIFNCSDNNLTTLEGGPQSVTGIFNCSDNNLTTLKGAPQSVSKFYCYNNRYLKSLKYLPKYIKIKQVSFENTAVYEIFKLFNDFSLSKIRYINDFKVIEDDKINLEMLNALLYDQGKPPVENVKGYDNM